MIIIDWSSLLSSKQQLCSQSKKPFYRPILSAEAAAQTSAATFLSSPREDAHENVGNVGGILSNIIQTGSNMRRAERSASTPALISWTSAACLQGNNGSFHSKLLECARVNSCHHDNRRWT